MNLCDDRIMFAKFVVFHTYSYFIILYCRNWVHNKNSIALDLLSKIQYYIVVTQLCLLFTKQTQYHNLKSFFSPSSDMLVFILTLQLHS